MTPDSAAEYGASFQMKITGQGFTPQSVVALETIENPQTTTFVNSTTLVVQVPAWFLADGGAGRIFITNPAPGGGITSALFHIVDPVPKVTYMEIPHARSGSSALYVAVDGANFNLHTVGTVNGSDRDTQHFGQNKAFVLLSASDLAAPGELRVGVHNYPPGGASITLPFTVSGAPATLISHAISQQLNATALAGDPVRSLVYAAIPKDAPSSPNRVVGLDPTDGSIVWSLPVTGSPDVLAISDDGQFLYVGKHDESTILRITLATHSPDVTIAIPPHSVDSPAYRAGAIVAVPGEPRTIAVSLVYEDAFLYGMGIVIVDDSVARPMSTTSQPSTCVIFFGGSANLIYGCDCAIGHGEGDYFTIGVDASGAKVLTHSPPALSMGPFTIFANGLFYEPGGLVVNPATLTQLGTLASFKVSNAIVASKDGNTLFTVDFDGRVRAADAHDFAAAGSVVVPDAAGTPSSLVRWGSNGLAFIRDDRIVFLQADFVH
jgi:hypothetical protein